MIMPGGVVRLQTLGGLAAQLFDSTLRTNTFFKCIFSSDLKMASYRTFDLKWYQIFVQWTNFETNKIILQIID